MNRCKICGKEVSDGRRFCSKSCVSKYGWQVNREERCKKISKSMRGNVNGRGNKGKVSPMKGRKHSEETKRKIGLANSIALKGNIPWNKGKKGVQVPWNKGLTKETDERLKKLSERMTEYMRNLSEEEKRARIEKMSKNRRKKLVGDKNPAKRPEVRKKISDRWKIRRLLGLKRKKCSDEDTIRRLTTVLKSLRENRPTSYEKRLIELIEKHHLPYKYVGDGSFWITSEGKHLNPDFVNINGRKVVVEVSAKGLKEIFCGGYDLYKDKRRRLFGKFGYEVVFIDEDDLFCEDWEDRCLEKLK